MDGTRVSDFSIERILSLKLPEASADQILLRPPAPVPVLVPVPVPVPVPGYLQYGGMFYPHGAGFRPPDFTGIHPNSGVFSLEAADVQRSAGFHQPGVSAQPQSRPKARMRTVFTHGQTKQLEALFELTDYPTGEARAEVARNTGLSEETVRVWFKNRRARRKRSKVKPASAPSSGDSEKKMFSCFL
ncbi:dharma [Amphiprion ocellaris]|uniref:Homeobox domain-containing protein n=1 Tax=Amphiprion ocellaris TaxID=80972 RepID=A0AAQ5Y4H6_AMPOC|nr:dharma [Amphiprion ocellaris]